MTSLVVLLAVLMGFCAGYFYRDLRDRLDSIENKMKEKPVDLGVTLGGYGPVNEYSRTNQDGVVGIVETKTPQRVEWDAQEALRREARGE